MHAAAEAHEGLCQLHAHRSAAQYDQLRHGHAQIEHVLVGEIGNAIETWEGRHGGTRARSDDEVSCGEVAAVDLKTKTNTKTTKTKKHHKTQNTKPNKTDEKIDGAD